MCIHCHFLKSSLKNLIEKFICDFHAAFCRASLFNAISMPEGQVSEKKKKI